MKSIRLCVCVVVVFVGLAGGCKMSPAERVAMYRETLEKAEPMLAEAHARTVEIQTALDQALTYVQDTNVPMEDRQQVWQTAQKIRNAIPDAVVYEQKLKTWIEQTKAQIDAIESAGPVDAAGEAQVVGGGVGGILAMLPPPFNAAAPLAVPIVAGVGWLLEWFRRRKVTAAATAIVKGIKKSAPEAAEPVKVQIEDQMLKAGIYAQANALVDKLKAA